MGALGSWGKVFEKISNWIPGRVEHWKNQKTQLEEERILLLRGACNAKTTVRLLAVDRKLAELNQLLSNKAQD